MRRERNKLIEMPYNLAIFSRAKTRFKSMIKQNRQSAGFTIIEIMVVVAILAILAATLVPRIMDEPDKARVAAAKTNIDVLEQALDLYKLDNFTYPTTEESLDALVNKPSNAQNWKKGGYIKRLPVDPWGGEYQYLNPGEHGEIDIYTMGSDRAPGGEGTAKDIGNWNEK